MKLIKPQFVLAAILLSACAEDKTTAASETVAEQKGAMDSVIETANVGKDEMYPEIRGLSWAVIFSEQDDIETAAFFRETLELDLEFELEGLHVFRLPSGQAFDVIGSHPEGSAGHVKFGFDVGDIALDKQRAKARGGEFIDVLGGHMEGVAAWEFVVDPDANQIQLGVELGDPAARVAIDQSGKALKITGISWIGYNTANLKATAAFYDDVLGASRFTSVVASDQKLMKAGDGVYLSVTQASSAAAAPATHVVIGFAVDDLAASADIIKSRGVELVGGEEQRDGLRWQNFKGPEGLVFRLVTSN